jgi:hypothetical protein
LLLHSCILKPVFSQRNRALVDWIDGTAQAANTPPRGAGKQGISMLLLLLPPISRSQARESVGATLWLVLLLLLL